MTDAEDEPHRGAASPDVTQRPRAVNRSTLTRAVREKTIASLPQAELVRRQGIAASIAGGLVVTLGLTAMVGWLAGLPWLYRISDTSASMKFSTALALSALGFAIVLTHRRSAATNLTVSVICISVAGFAAVTIGEYAFDTSYRLDNLFGLDPGRVGGDPAGRMSLATACGIELVAIALLLIARGKVMAGQLAASTCLVVALVTVVGYAYGVDSLYALGPFKSIALRTALGLGLACLGTLLRRTDAGYMSLISGNTAGGIIVRRFLPVAAVVPVLGGAIVVHLSDTRQGADNSAALIAVAATLVGVAGSVLVWLQASRLRVVDLQRAGAEDAFAVAREALRVRDELAVELAASERRTRQIIVGASAAYLGFDDHGLVTDWNPSSLELFGMSADDVRGTPVRDLVQRTNVGGPPSALMEFFAGNGPPPGAERYETSIITRDGRGATVDISLWSVTEGTTVTFHAFLNDITERKQVEIELRRANDDLADFSAAMAHDLRTPLTVVKGFSSLLRGRFDGGPEAEWVARIEGAADRGSRLIDDILAFARVGQAALVREPVDLAALAQRVAGDQVAATSRAAEVIVEELPIVPGDATLLETLLSNLVGNALKYVPSDRDPHVVIDSVHDDETGWPVLRVTDNGDPIADPTRLFEMFHRGAADDRTVGNGVGLAVCARIAELHGGRAWLETSEAGGPRFCVLLSSAPAAVLLQNG